jgi:hypothetical protein
MEKQKLIVGVKNVAQSCVCESTLKVHHMGLRWSRNQEFMIEGVTKIIKFNDNRKICHRTTENSSK